MNETFLATPKRAVLSGSLAGLTIAIGIAAFAKPAQAALCFGKESWIAGVRTCDCSTNVTNADCACIVSGSTCGG